MTLGDASFWLETAWWGGILILGLLGTLSRIRNSRWAQRRYTRRFNDSMNKRFLGYMARVRDEEIAAQREQDRPKA